MLSLILCVLAFAVTYACARRSLVAGLMAVFAVGYAYGIVRANVIQPFSHFVFDASIAALYIVHLPAAWRNRVQPALAELRPWFLFLIGWPLLLTLVPVQDYLVQIVGLRGNVYLLPSLLLGATLDSNSFRRIAVFLAMLNIVAFAFALAEFVIGIEPFFPRSAVTEIMYRSRDVGDLRAHRIPATFSSAHAYAGTMVATIPLLFGTVAEPGQQARWRPLLLIAMVCAGTGVFMAAARQPVIILAVVLLAGILRSRASLQSRLGAALFVVVLGFVSTQSDRLQRFRTLEDTDIVGERVQGSVNASFLQFARELPLGNGLGGGGTSMPYFLADRLREPKVIENEYGRVMMEQGVVGLIGFVAFLVTIQLVALRRRPQELSSAQRMALTFFFMMCVSGVIGLGLLASIPQTVIFLLLGGWMLRQPEQRAAVAHPDVARADPEPRVA